MYKWRCIHGDVSPCINGDAWLFLFSIFMLQPLLLGHLYISAIYVHLYVDSPTCIFDYCPSQLNSCQGSPFKPRDKQTGERTPLGERPGQEPT